MDTGFDSELATVQATAKATVNPTPFRKGCGDEDTDTIYPSPHKETNGYIRTCCNRRAKYTVYYKNCSAVRAAGEALLYAGDSRKLDRDGDGDGVT